MFSEIISGLRDEYRLLLYIHLKFCLIENLIRSVSLPPAKIAQHLEIYHPHVILMSRLLTQSRKLVLLVFEVVNEFRPNCLESTPKLFFNSIHTLCSDYFHPLSPASGRAHMCFLQNILFSFSFAQAITLEWAIICLAVFSPLQRSQQRVNRVHQDSQLFLFFLPRIPKDETICKRSARLRVLTRS